MAIKIMQWGFSLSIMFNFLIKLLQDGLGIYACIIFNALLVFLGVLAFRSPEQIKEVRKLIESLRGKH